MLIENLATDEHRLVTVTKLSPPVVVVRIVVPPPLNVTHPSGDETRAVSVCPLRQARTSERSASGFTSPLNEVEYAPRANLSLVVRG
jgi:hypothetical protein